MWNDFDGLDSCDVWQTMDCQKILCAGSFSRGEDENDQEYVGTKEYIEQWKLEI